MQAAILSALIRSPYSRGTTTAAAATTATARTKTRTGRRPCQQRQLKGHRNRQRKILDIDQSINQSNNQSLFIVRPNVDQRAGQLSLTHVGITKTDRHRTKNFNSMSSSYNTPCSKHKLAVSIYSTTETSLAISAPPPPPPSCDKASGWFGLAVTAFVPTTKLSYFEPGEYCDW